MKKEKLQNILTKGHVKTSKDKPSLIKKDESCFFDIITKDYIVVKKNSNYEEYLSYEDFRVGKIFVESNE